MISIKESRQKDVKTLMS